MSTAKSIISFFFEHNLPKPKTETSSTVALYRLLLIKLAFIEMSLFTLFDLLTTTTILMSAKQNDIQYKLVCKNLLV